MEKIIISSWLARKHDLPEVIPASDFSIEAETIKAICICYRDVNIWLPKSQIDIE
jgi:hypothetical protein